MNQRPAFQTNRRLSLEDAYRQASRQPRVVIVTTKLATAKASGKPCGVFATIDGGALSGFSGMIYIGDIKRTDTQTPEQIVNALVNPPGQRLSAEITTAKIENPPQGNPRLKINFAHISPADETEAAAPASPADAERPAAAAEVREPSGPAYAAEQVSVTVFLNGETGGFHCCKVTKTAGGGTDELLDETNGLATLEASLDAALTSAQAHKLQEIVVVDPKRLLLTTSDRGTIRVSQIRSMWLPTAKRKDARTPR